MGAGQNQRAMGMAVGWSSIIAWTPWVSFETRSETYLDSTFRERYGYPIEGDRKSPQGYRLRPLLIIQ